MKELLYFLLTIFALSMIFAYRHNLKHFVKKMYYGKEKYATMKAVMYGNYEEFLSGCFQLVRFDRQGLGITSYSYPSENEQKMIINTLRSKGWLMKFLSDISPEMRPVFIYPYGVKESIYFEVK